MRTSCLKCVRKHLAQASILLDESHLGYPHHKWFAIGHLAEAESESLLDYPKLASEIREMRVNLIENKKEPNFDDIIIRVCKLSGDYYKLHLLNSKKIKLTT
jgi:hypothetical protein